VRILIVSQYFWPECFILNELAQKLAEAGNAVVVATGKPNYPSGKIAPGYVKNGVQRETYAAGIEIIRIPSRPRGKTSAFNLSLNYLSFMLSGLTRLPWLLQGRRFDIILVFASPITAAIPAILLRYIKHSHLALWVQDLWPDAVISTGFVRNRLVINALGLMVRFVYRAANTLLVQSDAFVVPISKYVSKDKVFVLPNFAASSTEEIPPRLPDPIEGLFGGRYSVVFAGNLGRAQSLPTIVEAARILRSYPEILIVIAGTGSDAEWLKQTIASEDLTNIVLTGQLDSGLMPALFKLADCLLVTLRDEAGLNATIPSKVQAYLNAGRPIIGALNGEGARLIELAGAGLTARAEDGAGLAERIVTLYEMPAAERSEFAKAGQAYYDLHFNVDKVLSRFLRILQSRMKQSLNEIRV
jgi:glycosyltransferase involved in cell wall biosynthesis